MLDKLPASVRHFILVFVGAAGSVIAGDIAAANGVTAVEWQKTFIDALNAGSMAAVGILVAMYLTPLTRQYGLGSKLNPDSVNSDTEGAFDVEDNQGD